jgi:hypothetical protein
MDILKIRTDVLLKEFLQICLDIKPDIDTIKIKEIALQTIKYLIGNKEKRAVLGINQEVENLWYKSIESGIPDLDVYDHPYYLAEVFACWVVYSRKYLLTINSDKSLASCDSHLNYFNLKSITQDIGDIRIVVDLGCGLGYTTLALKQLFPTADVYGTNIPATIQYEFASKIANGSLFHILPEINQSFGVADLVFASEYFEHFEKPIDHLKDILGHLNPKYLLIANSFGTKGVGHYNTYLHNGYAINSKKMSKVFNNILRDSGYIKQYTRCWNDRPNYWKKGVK